VANTHFNLVKVNSLNFHTPEQITENEVWL